MLTSIIMSILGGGATGLLGVGLQRFFDWLNVKANLQRDQQKYANDLAMKKLDLDLMDKEWAGRVKVAEQEGKTATEVAATNAFAKSLLQEPERYATGNRPEGWLGNLGWFMLACTDVMRGVVRPLLTLYLCALTTFVWWQVRQLIKHEDLDPAAVLDIWKLVVNTILYLTTVCILWWFGTRNQAQPPAPKP